MIIQVPENAPFLREARQLQALCEKYAELEKRERRCEVIVDSVRGVLAGGEWIPGTDTYKLPGDLVDSLRALTEERGVRDGRA